MKKLNYLLLGLAGLTMASCSQDDLLNGGVDGNYQVTVQLPADMATRAIGDNAYAAQLLNYAIYDMDGNFVEKGTADFGGDTSLTLPLNLASGASFQIAFFAQSYASAGLNSNGQANTELDPVYTFSAENKTISVEYENMISTVNNEDGYDCFYKLHNTGVIGSTSMNTQATLTRPVAQINWGTNDAKGTVLNSYGNGLSNLQATLTTQAYNTFNLLDGTVTGQKKITIADFTPTDDAFPVDGYDYVAMQYVLVPSTQEIATLNLEVKSTSSSATNSIEVANAPLQANFRTNIYGSLLSDEINFQVDLSADWGGTYYVAEDFKALQTALNYSTPAGGTVYLNSDITLPSAIYITKNVTLNLNGHTLTYAGPSSGAAFLVNGNNSNFTITGEGTVTTTTDSPLVWLYNNGTVNIEGGTFINNYSHCVYSGGRSNSTGGNANISGGSFKTVPASTWALNIYDADRGTSKFNVTGGMFYEFNPQNNAAEGDETDFVNSDYQAVATTIDNDTWYVVVPKAATGETVKVVTSTSDMTDAITNASGNTTIYVTPNASVELPNNISNKTLTIKGLNPETSVIDSHNAYWTYDQCNLSFEDVTFNTYVNIYNHTSMGFINTVSQTYNNVKFIGEFHVFTGDASFTDCDFEYYNPSGTNYQLWCQTDGTVNITNSTMICNNAKAILVYGWPGNNGTVNNSVGGDININGLTVTSIGAPNDKAVVEIHSEIYTKAGRININNVTYTPQSYFQAGLWQEKNNNTEAPTKFYTIYVNGVEEQDGTQTASN